jgi:hypothetical protein
MKSPRVISDPEILGGTPALNTLKRAILWKFSWKTFPLSVGNLRFKF